MPIDPALTRSDLWYDLPEAAIAQSPVEPRDSARLLDTRDDTDRVFADLPSMLAPGDLVVVNRTRVRPARLGGRRVDTGGAVEVLVLVPLGDGTWEVLVRPARRLRRGVVIGFDRDGAAELLTDPVDGRAVVRFDVPGGDPEAWFLAVGSLPLPPYIRGSIDDPERYQTVFGDRVGSAAAPTAALHVTHQVLGGLASRGVEVAKLELDVGLGTFRPVATERLVDHTMHAEAYRVDDDVASAVAACRRRGSRVVAIGTTVTRTLESVACGDGLVEAGSGTTDLFITPGHRFGVVDLLVTNFHVPGSTLVALVAAALGPRWRDTYATALERSYRFLSFGDAMFVEVRR